MAPVKYSIIKRDIKSDKESAVNFDSIEVNADIAHKITCCCLMKKESIRLFFYKKPS